MAKSIFLLHVVIMLFPPIKIHVNPQAPPQPAPPPPGGNRDALLALPGLDPGVAEAVARPLALKALEGLGGWP